MPQFDASTVMKNITIQSFQFAIPQPYPAGHVVNEAEAGVLNQTLGENLRNGFAAIIRGRVEKKEQAKSAEAKAEIEATLTQEKLVEDFATYVEGYEFGVRRASPMTSADPVEREAQSMARETVKEKLKAGGYKLKELEDGMVEQLAAQLLEANPAFMIEAARRVESKRTLEAIGVDIPVKAPAAPGDEAETVVEA